MVFPIFASTFLEMYNLFLDLAWKYCFHKKSCRQFKSWLINSLWYQNESTHFMCGKFKNKYFNPEHIFFWVGNFLIQTRKEVINHIGGVLRYCFTLHFLFLFNLLYYFYFLEFISPIFRIHSPRGFKSCKTKHWHVAASQPRFTIFYSVGGKNHTIPKFGFDL